MASKAALKKAYDAGQAAQWRGLAADACPFEPGDECDAWNEGREAELDPKWTGAAGVAHEKELGN